MLFICNSFNDKLRILNVSGKIHSKLYYFTFLPIFHNFSNRYKFWIIYETLLSSKGLFNTANKLECSSNNMIMFVLYC